MIQFVQVIDPIRKYYSDTCSYRRVAVSRVHSKLSPADYQFTGSWWVARDFEINHRVGRSSFSVRSRTQRYVQTCASFSSGVNWDCALCIWFHFPDLAGRASHVGIFPIGIFYWFLCNYNNSTPYGVPVCDWREDRSIDLTLTLFFTPADTPKE